LKHAFVFAACAEFDAEVEEKQLADAAIDDL